MLFPMLLTGCDGGNQSKSPQVVDDTADGLPSQPLTINVTSNDDPGTTSIGTPILDANGNTIGYQFEESPLGWDHIELKKPPSQGYTVINNLNVVYTSNGTSDSDSFEYTAYTQLGEAGSAVVNVHLLAPGDNLAVADGPVSLPPGFGMFIDVLKNDVGTDLEIISTTPARFGSVSIERNPNGTGRAIPKILYVRGGGQYSSGTDEFTYTITGGSQASVTVVFNGFAEGLFQNASESVSVQFKVDARNVTELNLNGVPLVLRPQQGNLGRYQKGRAAATVTVVAETIPPLPGTPVQWTGQLGNDDRIIFNDLPTPTLSKQGSNNPF